MVEQGMQLPDDINEEGEPIVPSLVTPEMVVPGDLVRILDYLDPWNLEMNGTVTHVDLGISDTYKWLEVGFQGGDDMKDTDFLVMSMPQAADDTNISFGLFTDEIKPSQIGLRRGDRLPDPVTYDGVVYNLQDAGRATFGRLKAKKDQLTDIREDRAIIYYGDYAGDRVVDIGDGDVAKNPRLLSITFSNGEGTDRYTDSASVWLGKPLERDSVTIMNYDLERPRKGNLTKREYTPPAKNTWQRFKQRWM